MHVTAQKGFTLFDGFAKHRLLCKQLPAHSRPFLALAAGFVVALAAFPEYKARHTARLRALSGGLLILFAAQLAVGALSLMLQAPLPVQLLHLLLADALWITLVLFTAERGAGREQNGTG